MPEGAIASEKRRILLLILILTAVVLLATVITNVLLYESEFEHQRKMLVVTAKSQARLIESIARFNRKYNRGHPGGTFQATLSQVAQAYDNFEGFGETGEFTLAKREKDRIVYLFHQHIHELQIPGPIPFESGLAEPMRHALMGHSGSIISFDYRGEKVLAAYEPVAELNLGIVAKIDLAEIHAPFVKTGIITGLLAFIAILAGAFLIVRITNPIIKQLQISQRAEKEAHTQLIDAIENLPAAFMLFDGEERLVLRNSLMGNIFPEHEAAGTLKPGARFEDIIRFSSQGLIADARGREEEWVRERMAQFRNQSSTDFELQWADGRMFQVFDHKTPDGWTVSIRLDITERKRAEEALRESEEQLRTILTNAPVVLWALDSDGLFTLSEGKGLEALGLKPGEAVGQSVFHLYKDYPDIIADSRRALAGESFLTTWEVDGFAYEARYSPLRDSAGEIIGTIGLAVDTTERNRAEQALQESEAKYRDLVETSQDLIWRDDREGRFTYLNPAWESTLGYKLEEMIGNEFPNFKRPGEREQSFQRHHRTMQGNSATNYETTYISKSGEEVILNFTAKPLSDASGQVVGAQGTATDITERKKAEEALRESETKYRGLVEGSLEGIVVHRHGEILFANQAFADIFGYDSVDEVLALDSLDETIAPEDLELLCERRAARMRGEDVQTAYEYTSLRKNGSRIEVNCLNSFIDWEGSPAILVTYFDITERKKAEEALRESETNFRNLIEDSIEGVAIISRERRFVFANQALADMFGCESPGEMLNRSTMDFIAPLERDRMTDMFHARLRGEETPHQYQYQGQCTDGSLIWVDRHVTLVAWKGETAILSRLVEITDQKRNEEKIRVQEQLLIHADKMATLGIFVSGVAHEINNPNTSIMMNVPLLKKMWRDILPMLQRHWKRDPDFTLANIPFDEAQEVFPSLLSDISGSSQRIKRFVENLKNYAQKREIREMREIDVNEVVESAVTLMQSQINRMTHAFSTKYDRSIPSFEGDFMDIEQIVINLITNACQALSNKEKGVRITTRFAKDRERILVEVADEGEGIPEEILGKITDPFFSTKYETGGTGLGLSVSLDILKKYGGNLEFSSTPGVGTTVTLVLPYN